MDLAQLANLGEFIGGVAVLVTLIYLAVQVRHNSRLLDIQNLQASAAGHQRIQASLLSMNEAESGAMQRVYVENATELSPFDMGRAETYFNSYLTVVQCDFLVGGRSDSYKEYWDASIQILSDLASAPFFQLWWDRLGRRQYTASFASLVDATIAELDGSYSAEIQSLITGNHQGTR